MERKETSPQFSESSQAPEMTRRKLLGGLLASVGATAAVAGVLSPNGAEASESIKTVFTSEDAAAEYAEDNVLKLVKDYHHNYGFVSPELAERQLLNRDFVQVYRNGMIVLYDGFKGWEFTGAGDVTRVTIQKESNGGDKKPSGGGGGVPGDRDGDGIPDDTF